MNNGYDVNQALQYFFQMKNAGQNPQSLMQILNQKNIPIQQLMTQFQNMSNGRSLKEFMTQYARQNGVNEQNIFNIQQMFK